MSAAGQRIPPHDEDAERALLSALISKQDRIDDCAKLRPDHFYIYQNRLVYEAIIALDTQRKPVDEVTVAVWLKGRGETPEAGWVGYLTMLCDKAPSVANLGAYAEVVKEKARIRSVISASQKAAAEGYGDVGDVQTWVQGVEQEIFDLAHQEASDDLQSLSDGIRSVIRRSEEAARRGSAILGTPTGFAAFDELVSGLHPADLVILAARPGMGKTSWALNVAVNVAAPRKVNGQEVPGLGVCVFSLEMPKDQVTTRILCSEAQVDLGALRRNRLTSEDWDALNKAGPWLASLPLWIDDTPALTLMALRAKVRRKKRELSAKGQELGLIVVDYLQLMRSPAHAKNREQEVAEISKGLKLLGKEMKAPVMALSQMNRAVESRAGAKRPQLSDLRESGSIEQDADLVVFIHRDGYYDRESALSGYAELLVEKQRNGPTGSEWLTWEAKSTRFGDCDAKDLATIRDEIDKKVKQSNNKKGGAQWLSARKRCWPSTRCRWRRSGFVRRSLSLLTFGPRPRQRASWLSQKEA